MYANAGMHDNHDEHANANEAADAARCCCCENRKTQIL
jgi:hypothetical protein